MKDTLSDLNGDSIAHSRSFISTCHQLTPSYLTNIVLTVNLNVLSF